MQNDSSTIPSVCLSHGLSHCNYTVLSELDEKDDTIKRNQQEIALLKSKLKMHKSKKPAEIKTPAQNRLLDESRPSYSQRRDEEATCMKPTNKICSAARKWSGDVDALGTQT